MRYRFLIFPFLSLVFLAVTPPGIVFEDVTKNSGLQAALTGMMGHAAAWGDFDQDGNPDLFVAGFCDRQDQEYAPAKGPVPSVLFHNLGNGKFESIKNSAISFCGRTSGAMFADLNQDGFPELYVANNPKGELTMTNGIQVAAQKMQSKLFENRKGSFIDISSQSGAIPAGLLTARGIGVFDYNNDGLIDLFIVEDKFQKGKDHARSILLKNKGGLKFEIANAEAGIPDDIYGFGIAVADINDDGRPDFFVTHSNRLFLSQSGNRFKEATETEKAFLWNPVDNEDWPSGAAFGDLNGDGRLDLVISNHHDPAHNRVFLNRGIKNGIPVFEDVTSSAGLSETIPTKTPHVEIQDFDNDGLPDIFFSAGWKENGAIIPLIYRNTGTDKNGIPHFQRIHPLGSAMIYFPGGPTADFNHDGKLDLFLVSWYPNESSHLLANRTAGGNWLQVKAPIGSKIILNASGKLLGMQQIYPGFGFSSGQLPIAHFGLGKAAKVDVEAFLPNGSKQLKKSVSANQIIEFK